MSDRVDSMLEQLTVEEKVSLCSGFGPWGHTFNEIYDLDTLEPRPKYVEVYSRVKSELVDIGIEFKY